MALGVSEHYPIPKAEIDERVDRWTPVLGIRSHAAAVRDEPRLLEDESRRGCAAARLSRSQKGEIGNPVLSGGS